MVVAVLDDVALLLEVLEDVLVDVVLDEAELLHVSGTCTCTQERR